MNWSPHQANGLRKEGNGNEYNVSIFRSKRERSAEFLHRNIHWWFSSSEGIKERESLRENPEAPAEDRQAATASQGAAHEKRLLLLPAPQTGEIKLV